MAAPYDILTVVLNTARGRLNDSITTLAAVGGKILDNTQPFAQQMVNSAWRKLQEFLADMGPGYTGLKQEQDYINVPQAGSTDPLLQVSLSYSQYFDGVTSFPSFALPQNLIQPDQLWERTTGSKAIMTEMDRIINGLPAIPKMNWNRQWEWRDDTLYMPGALTATDIRLRYAAYFPDFADISANPTPPQVIGPWYAQPVPIMRCLDPFADYICREFAVSLKDMDGAVAFQTSAEASANRVFNRDTIQPRAIRKASEYGKMRDQRTPEK